VRSERGGERRVALPGQVHEVYIVERTAQLRGFKEVYACFRRDLAEVTGDLRGLLHHGRTHLVEHGAL